MNTRTTLTAVLAVFASTGAALAAGDPPSEFRLTVYGMVCNQCAYGVEQSLQHTEGVEDAIVDLRAGSVVVVVNPISPPSARVLAQRIRDQRVSLRKMEATLIGRVVHSVEAGWSLMVGSERYRLTAENESIIERHANGTVVATGVFEGLSEAEDAQEKLRFVIRDIRTS